MRTDIVNKEMWIMEYANTENEEEFIEFVSLDRDVLIDILKDRQENNPKLKDWIWEEDGQDLLFKSPAVVHKYHAVDDYGNILRNKWIYESESEAWYRIYKGCILASRKDEINAKKAAKDCFERYRQKGAYDPVKPSLFALENILRKRG